MSQTQPRQNYHTECEAGVNKQINLELYASYVYQSMVSRHFAFAGSISFLAKFESGFYSFCR